MGLPADLDRRRAGELRARLFGDDDRPKGPIYMCYDAALQRRPKTHDVPLPPLHAVAAPSPMAPDPRAIEAIADKLLKAEHPMLLPNMPPARRRLREHRCAGRLDRLACGTSTTRSTSRTSTRFVSAWTRSSLTTTDLILGLDVKDWEKQLTELNNAKAHPRIPAAAVVRLRRDRLCRGRHQQMGDGLLPQQPCSVRALATPRSASRSA